MKPNSQPNFFVYTSSHNNGIVLVEEGTWQDNKLVLSSTAVSRSSISSSPHVLGVSLNIKNILFGKFYDSFFLSKTRREIELINKDSMALKMFMSTTTNAQMEEHLTIQYEKLN